MNPQEFSRRVREGMKKPQVQEKLHKRRIQKFTWKRRRNYYRLIYRSYPKKWREEIADLFVRQEQLQRLMKKTKDFDEHEKLYREKVRVILQINEIERKRKRYAYLLRYHPKCEELKAYIMENGDGI